MSPQFVSLNGCGSLRRRRSPSMTTNARDHDAAERSAGDAQARDHTARGAITCRESPGVRDRSRCRHAELNRP
jgi:hypothetical protein